MATHEGFVAARSDFRTSREPDEQQSSPISLTFPRFEGNISEDLILFNKANGSSSHQGAHRRQYRKYSSQGANASSSPINKQNRVIKRSLTGPISNFEAKSRRGLELQKANDLLNEMFPRHVAQALRDGKRVEPESFDCVTIFFSDIVGFTELAGSLSPMKVSDLLDRLYLKFDALSRKHDIFKVETIGDAWMGVTNVTHIQLDHTKRIANFACDAIREACATYIDRDDPSRGFVQIRVGFHCGPVIANVVGSRNPHYTLIGDTVNTASRMESHSEPMRILCSEQAANLLIEQAPEIPLKSRGKIDVKGKGRMRTFWVNESCDNRIRSIVTKTPSELSTTPLSALSPLEKKNSSNMETEIGSSAHSSSAQSLTPFSQRPSFDSFDQVVAESPPLANESIEDNRRKKKKKRDKDGGKKKKKKKKKKGRSRASSVDEILDSTQDLKFEDFLQFQSDINQNQSEIFAGEKLDQVVETTETDFVDLVGGPKEVITTADGDDGLEKSILFVEKQEKKSSGNFTTVSSLSSKSPVESTMSPSQGTNSEYHGKMLESFLRRNGEDDYLAASTAVAFESFLKQQAETEEEDEKDQSDATSAVSKEVVERILEKHNREHQKASLAQSRNFEEGSIVGSTGDWAEYSFGGGNKEPRRWAGISGARSEAGSIGSHLKPSRSRVAFLEQASVGGIDRKSRRRGRGSLASRSTDGTQSVGEVRSLISFGAKSAPGAFGLSSDLERSFEDQFACLNKAQQNLVMDLKFRWRAWGRSPLPDIWYLKFARCSPGDPFTFKSAVKTMSNYKYKYYGLSIASMEDRLRSKIIFPVKNLKSRDGHDMFYMKPSRFYPRKMTTASFVENLVYVMDCMLEKEQAQRNGIGLVTNMSDWRMHNFSVQYWHKFMMTLQCKITPTRIQVFLIVNPPVWFGSIWRIMRPMLHEDFRSKVCMISFHQMREHLAPGYEDFLPDDIYSGRSNTHTMVEDFIASRRRIESDRNLQVGRNSKPGKRKHRNFRRSLGLRLNFR